MGSQATLEEITETIDRSTLHQPSAGLREFLSSLPQAKRVSDRRKSERCSVIADVIVVPLDKDCHPLAEPFMACLSTSQPAACVFIIRSRSIRRCCTWKSPRQARRE